jgi:aerobic carbon-monoxide dehydrogenase large subunit
LITLEVRPKPNHTSSSGARTGDTGPLPHGGGTFGSRSAVTAGNAVHLASVQLRDRVLAAAGALLDAEPGRLVLHNGHVVDPADPARTVSLRDVARSAVPGGTLARPGLEESAYSCHRP